MAAPVSRGEDRAFPRTVTTSPLPVIEDVVPLTTRPIEPSWLVVTASLFDVIFPPAVATMPSAPMPDPAAEPDVPVLIVTPAPVVVIVDPDPFA